MKRSLAQLREVIGLPNVQAFLRALRLGEGTSADNGYRVLFGGGTFPSFSNHPRTVVTKTMKGKKYSSSAAGAYQILTRTWNGLVAQFSFTDFSPDTQDLAAVALIDGRKALDDVIAGRIEDAVRKCNKEWASLPGSPYGQPTVTMEEFLAEYAEWGGKLSADSVPQPSEAPQPTPTEPTASRSPFSLPDFLKKGITMSPFIAAVLPALIDIVPKLGKLFGSGSEVSERNVKAAEVIVDAAKSAIGARNEQELLEILKEDPSAVSVVKEAIESSWFKLDEVGGGIESAREAALAYSQPGGPDFRRNPAFWISLAFILMPFLIVLDMLFVNPELYDVALKTQIITAVVGLLTIVGAFWLGTSYTKKRQDQDE